MSYKDKKFGPLLPTRTGTPIGGASERQMLDRMGGSEGYRKDFRTNADGSTTMLTTKNGVPQFQNLGGGLDDESKNTAGLASGAVFTNLAGSTYYTRTTPVAAYAAPAQKKELVDKIDKTLIGTQPPDKSPTTAKVASEPEMIKRCPPSLFTGKMRLYVQCLYGSLSPLPQALELIDTGISIPTLSYGGVMLDTSCGVFLDQAKAKHYLISITAGFAYELVRAPGVKWLEKKLLDPLLSSALKAKVEAYLLAQSYPSNPVSMDLPPRIAGGMGYGWHFNWSGTAADCVGLETSTRDSDGTACYKTTHWRIAFSLGNGRVSASLSKVTEAKWRNKRHIRNICFPQWDMSGFSKLGFLFLPEFGTGPLYAFYLHSTDTYPGTSQLQVVTWSANIGVNVPADGTAWPEYMNIVTYEVCGTDACGYEIRHSHLQNVFSLSVGAESVSIIASNENRTVATARGASSGTQGLSEGTWIKGDIPLGGFGDDPPFLFDNGRPSPIPAFLSPQFWVDGNQLRYVGSGGGTYEQAAGGVAGQYAFLSGSPMTATWSREIFSRGTVKDGYLIGFPPYYDAEAYYVWSRQDQVDGEAGNSFSCTGPGFRKFYAVGGSAPQEIVSGYDGYWSPLFGDGSAGTGFSREIRTYGTPSEKLVCGVAVLVPGAPLNYSQFLNSVADSATPSIYLQSSTRGAVYSAQLLVDVNNAPLVFGSGWATYTGWA